MTIRLKLIGLVDLILERNLHKLINKYGMLSNISTNLNIILTTRNLKLNLRSLLHTYYKH